MQQQANELVRGQIITPAIHAAHAVSVAIGDEANVVRVLFEKGRTAPVVLLNRLRVNAPEKDIVLAVQRRHSASRAGQQFLEAARAHAKEGLMGETQF